MIASQISDRIGNDVASKHTQADKAKSVRATEIWQRNASASPVNVRDCKCQTKAAQFTGVRFAKSQRVCYH